MDCTTSHQSSHRKPHAGAHDERARTTAGLVDLDLLMFTAKFDYVTLDVGGLVELPQLTGTVKWSAANHYKTFTVHDPIAADLAALAKCLGPVRVPELEITVDLRARPAVPMLQRESMLRSIMIELFAIGLDPSRGPGVNQDFRAFFRKLGAAHIVRPFNRRLPRHSDQQLHGGRDDDVQVKAYLKRRDQGRSLSESDYVARVEARIGEGGLAQVGVHVIDDLFSFSLRKRVMPYFTHVKGTRRRTRRADSAADQSGMDRLLQEHDRRLWQKTGVGAFKPGGTGDAEAVRLVRDTKVNDRIGQALGRLQAQLKAVKFVRLDNQAVHADQALVRSGARLGGLRVTT